MLNLASDNNYYVNDVDIIEEFQYSKVILWGIMSNGEPDRGSSHPYESVTKCPSFGKAVSSFILSYFKNGL
jgi:hypothetical protein